MTDWRDAPAMPRLNSLVYPNAPPMRPVEKYRVYGYTQQQLDAPGDRGEIEGYNCVGEAHALEYVAHIMKCDGALIVVQKVDGGGVAK